MTNVHIHVPEAPYWDRDIYGSAMYNGVPVFSKLGRGPRGYKGDKGDKGDTGAMGEDGWSPWIEFEYPSSPEYPYEPGDPMYGHTVMVVHDRDGVKRVPLDLKVDPDQMTDEDLAKLAGLFTNKRLWPRWVEWQINPASTLTNIGDYSRIDLSMWNGNDSQICLINHTMYYKQYPEFFYDPASSTTTCNVNDFVIDDAQFIRNGLDYQFIKGPGELFTASGNPAPTYISPGYLEDNSPHFFLSSDSNFLYFYPQLSSGHFLEDCSLRLYLYPKYPE